MIKKNNTKSSKNNKKTPFSKLDLDTQVELVNKALEESVYETLAMDGGGLEIMDIDKNKVFISYYGACGSCPMATSGTLMFIQDVLREKIDKKIKVEVIT